VLKIDRGAVRAEEKLDGKRVVTSNDDTLSAEDLALGYKRLMRVENCWRTIKSGLRTRPVFHWKPHRISAHVSLRVLALLIERIAEIRTGKSWRNVRALLDTVKVVEYERGEAVVRQAMGLRDEVEVLLRKLKIPAPPRFHGVQTASAAITRLLRAQTAQPCVILGRCLPFRGPGPSKSGEGLCHGKTLR
jgi:hypothetical protein